MSEEKKYYEMDIDGFEDIPKYNGPELMTEEYCGSPHFLEDYESTIAWRHAMAARCIEENREVVFVRNLPFVDNISSDGQVEEHVAWESPVGDTIRFVAEARNPKTGEWEEKTFNISTAERSAMVDGELILEGTKADGTKYTISSHDFARELDIERDIRGLPPISQEEKAYEHNDTQTSYEEDVDYTKEEILDDVMSPILDVDESFAKELEGPSVGIFKENDGAEMEPYYNDPEYGPSY